MSFNNKLFESRVEGVGGGIILGGFGPYWEVGDYRDFNPIIPEH